MGQTASSITRHATNSFSRFFSKSENENEVNSHCKGLVPFGASMFVHKRQGSMYFDEDGDLAHEFYKEVVRGNRLTMERCTENLRPQGEVDLSIPRLHADLPVFLYEVRSTVLRSSQSSPSCR